MVAKTVLKKNGLIPFLTECLQQRGIGKNHMCSEERGADLGR